MATYESAPLSFISADFRGIAHLLRDQQLKVPPYQRSYSWQEEQIGAFWDDLSAALLSRQPVYFLGSIVLSGSGGSGDGRLTVIDGQQRLATTTLLLATIRNAFRSQHDERRADVIEREYISTTSLRDAREAPRLLLSEADQRFFSRLLTLTDGDSIWPESESEKRLQSAYSLLQECVDKEVRRSGSAYADNLFRWIDFLDKQAGAIVVRVHDDADAYSIFETLNARGLELTPADVIKNYLFALNRSDFAAVQRDWTDATRAIESSAEPIDFLTFLRHFWSSRQGATRERALYASIRAEVDTPSAAREFCTELSIAAPLYTATLNTDDPLWDTWPSEVREHLDALNTLGLQQVRPLILAAAGQMSPPEFANLLARLVAWSVRTLIVGGGGGGAAERYYAEAATRVSARRLRSAEDVFAELRQVIPSDTAFFEAFSTKRVMRQNHLKYYLSALVEGATQSGYRQHDNTWVRSTPFEAPHEWVLAQPMSRRLVGNEPRYFSAEEIAAYANRLGNFFVVPRMLNQQLGQGPKRVLGLTEVDPFSPEILTEWRPEDVVRRQAAMAHLAVRVWPAR